MAQAGYTPLLIYASGTASNVPSPADLTSSAAGAELALNYADGKLYYKNSSGVVQLLASNATASNSISFGTTGLTPSTATTGAVTVAGTLATTNGGTGLTSFASGQLFYASSSSAVGQSANLTFASNILNVHGINVGRGAGAVSSNTAVGASSLSANTTGSQNTAVGNDALLSNTGGNNNTAVGNDALQSNNGGNGNTAFGSLALATNSSGGTNVAVGYAALNVSTTGDSNTAIGASAGSAITTGAKNCILGSYTGNQGGLDIRTSSNYIVLSDGDGNPRAYWNGANATFNGGLTLTAYLRTAVASVTSASTVTPTSDASNQYNVTALAVPATFAAPSGTPVDGQKLVLRIKDDGTARALTWNAIYRVVGTVLPTTTVATKTTYVGCIYNSADTVWDVVAVTTQS
jgi:hypothetical protein